MEEGRDTEVRADWLIADACDMGDPNELKEILFQRALEFLLAGVRLSPQDYALLSEESQKAFASAQAKIDSEREASIVTKVLEGIGKGIGELLADDKK